MRTLNKFYNNSVDWLILNFLIYSKKRDWNHDNSLKCKCIKSIIVKLKWTSLSKQAHWANYVMCIYVLNATLPNTNDDNYLFFSANTIIMFSMSVNKFTWDGLFRKMIKGVEEALHFHWVLTIGERTTVIKADSIMSDW